MENNLNILHFVYFNVENNIFGKKIDNVNDMKRKPRAKFKLAKINMK